MALLIITSLLSFAAAVKIIFFTAPHVVTNSSVRILTDSALLRRLSIAEAALAVERVAHKADAALAEERGRIINEIMPAHQRLVDSQLLLQRNGMEMVASIARRQEINMAKRDAQAETSAVRFSTVMSRLSKVPDSATVADLLSTLHQPTLPPPELGLQKPSGKWELRARPFLEVGVGVNQQLGGTLRGGAQFTLEKNQRK